MKQQSTIFPILVAYIPILALALSMCISDAHRCVPINPGGKELMCSLDYAPAGIKIAVGTARVISGIALLATIRLALQQRLTRPGLAGLIASIVLTIFALSLKLFYGDDDYP